MHCLVSGEIQNINIFYKTAQFTSNCYETQEVTQTGIETPMSLKQELRNQLERERRTELAKLLSDLAHEVISPAVQAKESRTANITVIKSVSQDESLLCY